jgi:serine/threonine-protein kinase RIO1
VDPTDDDAPVTGSRAIRGGGKAKVMQRREVLAPTSEGVLDGHTRMKLQKIQNAGVFDRLDGVVQVGKEASVYHAEGAQKEYAVKIFKTTMAEFKDREKYLGGSSPELVIV